MRGPPIGKTLSVITKGITPAYAGTTLYPNAGMYTASDHPRLCGDHALQLYAYLIMSGSPPLMRGPREEGHTIFESVGITPAYAGTTSIFIM